MKLSVNYSEEVKSLLEEGKIDFIDYLKLFGINGDLSPFDWCVKHKNVMFHGMTGAGSNVVKRDFMDNRDLALMEKYYKDSNTPHISFHIAAGYDKDIVLESEDELIEIVKNNVEELRKVFNYDILLENIPVGKKNENIFLLAKPEFISRVIEEANTYFLLDIAHARAAAYTLGIPYIDYINALPLDKVREVHLSGCVKNSEGQLRPNHSKMNEEDYEILDYLISKCKNLEFLTLEFGPYDAETGETIPMYGKINYELKDQVYENLIRLNEYKNK